MKLLLLLLLLLLPARGASGVSVSGEAGQSVTLPCRYEASSPLPVCWNRGEIPTRGCSPQLLATDGLRVKEDTRASGRYQLLGDLERGDVSLTIRNLSEADAGRYGCRVDVPGWFNDQKHHFHLVVAPTASSAPPSSSSAPPLVTEVETATQTAGHMTSAQTWPPTDLESLISVQDGGVLTVVLVSVALGLVLVAAAGLFFVVRRRLLNKLPQRQMGGAVRFSTTSSTLQLHCRGSAVENIYQIDSGEYDYLP